MFGSLLSVFVFSSSCSSFLCSSLHTPSICMGATQLCIGNERIRIGYEFIFPFLFHSSSNEMNNTHTHTNRTIGRKINKNPVYRAICIVCCYPLCVTAFRGQRGNYRFNQISRSIHLSLGAFFSLHLVELTEEMNQ